MGTIVAASCPCGYESDSVMVGSGFAGPEHGLVLIQCEVCHHLGSAGVSTKEKRCSYCRSRKVRLFEEELPDEMLVCPACGKQTAVLQDVGLWD